MSPEQFEQVVRETIDAIPQKFREALTNVEILIEDEPDEELGLESKDLLGLYTGTPLPERSEDNAGELPDVIHIFRLPHLKLGLPPDELREEIAATLIHEIAHYFGLDDDQLDELGWG